MYNFRNDYSEGAHPDILNKISETNLVQQYIYGKDKHSVQVYQASDKIIPSIRSIL